MDKVTHIDAYQMDDGTIILALTDDAGGELPIQLSTSAAVRLASVLLVQLSQLPKGNDPSFEIVSPHCELVVGVRLPDIRQVVAQVGPLNISLGPLESIRSFLSQESSLLHAAPPSEH